MDKRDELTQIVRAVQKDIGKFELLYSHIVKKVYFWCYSIIGNEAEAKDVTQEVMIRVYNKMHTLTTPETFNSWMYRLARNYSLNYLRKYNKEEISYLSDDNYNERFESNIREERRDNIPDEAYDFKETKKVITEFIEELPTKQKEVIILYYLEEMSIDEVSKTLKYNAGSVKSRLYSGRKNLENKLKDYQAKHGVKLYSATGLALVGMMLQDYEEQITSNQDLSFNKATYKPTNLTKITKIVNSISSNIGIASGVAIGITAVVVVAVIANIPNESSEFPTTAENAQWINKTDVEKNINNEDIRVVDSLIDDLNTFNSGKGNPYIESIVYDTFPTRSNIDVEITLKKDLIDRDIKMLFENQEMSIKKSERTINIVADKNGEYIIEIDNKKFAFAINSIDDYAPEVVGLLEQEDHLQLIINDEESQINYEKSYLEYEKLKYPIMGNNKVIGKFKGKIRVYIYNDSNQYIYYQFDLNE